MSVVAGPFHVAAAVLIVSGVAKLRAPWSVRPMLELVAQRVDPALRVGPRAGQLLGAIEVLLGASCLLGVRAAAFLAAVAYALFAELMLTARNAEMASCGCFGAAPSPPSVPHVVANLVSAVVAFVAALHSPVPSLWGAVTEGVAWGLPYLFAVGAATSLVVALETVGAEVVTRRRLLAAEPPAARPRSSRR